MVLIDFTTGLKVSGITLHPHGFPRIRNRRSDLVRYHRLYAHEGLFHQSSAQIVVTFLALVFQLVWRRVVLPSLSTSVRTYLQPSKLSLGGSPSFTLTENFTIHSYPNGRSLFFDRLINVVWMLPSFCPLSVRTWFITVVPSFLVFSPSSQLGKNFTVNGFPNGFLLLVVLVVFQLAL